MDSSVELQKVQSKSFQQFFKSFQKFLRRFQTFPQVFKKFPNASKTFPRRFRGRPISVPINARTPT